MAAAERISLVTALAAVICLGVASRVDAQSLPPVNLGLTSFVDGGPPAGPGFYYQSYFQFFHADKFRDKDGNSIPPLDGTDLDVYALLNQFIYQSDQKVPILGGKWGMDVIIPLVKTDMEDNPLGLRDNNEGLGDIVLGPYLQWDPIIKDGRPLFMHRVEFQMILPTGKYDNDRLVNPGSNFFSFNPYWSGTVFITPRWEFSTRIHYLFNDENDDPFGGADTAQAGQAIHLNFATSYEVIEKTLRVGLNGYYLKQITDSQVNGADIAGHEQVLGLGPGAVWHINQDNHLFLNLYFETAVENRPEGMRLVFRWTHHF